MNELKGKIKFLGEVTQVTEKFRKQDLVIETNDQYPQTIIFQLSNDNTEKANGLKLGDDILVKYNVRGRQWANPQGEIKYFNTLDAWFIQKQDNVKVTGGIEKNFQEEAINDMTSQDDGLPF